MVRRLSAKARFVNRGLPDSYDPHYFYEYRIMKRSKEATGIEGLVYQILPWSLIKSFAIAIDPLSNFKTAPGRISQVNRTRTRTIKSVLDNHFYDYDRVTRTVRALTNYEGHPGRYGPKNPDSPIYDRGRADLPDQPSLPYISKDTTYRTRPFGYTMGEFEKFKHRLLSPSKNRSPVDDSTQYFSLLAGQDYPNYHESKRTTQLSMPTAARYRDDYYAILRDNERNLLLQSMQKHALGMYKGLNPLHRNYTLFRNIVELRDIPRSISTLRESLRALSDVERLLDNKILSSIRSVAANPAALKRLLKNLPNEYLSYSFGWRQLYSDVYDLVVKPERISKQIDFLIRRAGKPTTYRTKRSFVSADLEPPGFNGELFYLHGEGYVDRQNRVQREITLDMVINTTFSFPGLNSPTFRKDLFNEKLGINPRITDLYNLTPWTWLIDWFTGLGNYIEIIDETSRDPSIINWGFITGRSSVTLQSIDVTELESRRGIFIDGVGGFETSKDRLSVTNTLEVDIQLRKNLAGIFDVKLLSEPETLSAYQQSILGALLLQRTNFRR